MLFYYFMILEKIVDHLPVVAEQLLAFRQGKGTVAPDFSSPSS